ncbi:MAG: L-glutamate gamma-semialdehyde dehydrogenase [Rhodocyclales bacterium]|nr:L-glutamate gamma-semialdehyde dehydrogenase [Rhodocyclales bacterium]
MRLPSPYRPEADIVTQRLALLDGALDWGAVARRARPWVQAVRDHPPPFWAMESLLHEYPISSAEGLALMRLAEALLRVPDAETAIALTADQLGRADFDTAGDSALARLSSAAISLSKKLLWEADASAGMLTRLGARGIVAASLRAVQLLGHQFVFAEDIAHAVRAAGSARGSRRSLFFSYDMLGEGARTEADALHYLDDYANAIKTLAAEQDGGDCQQRDGISIKLSALHPRYDYSQHDRVMEELVPRVWALCELAAQADINLTIDAEEVERLELSLDVFAALAALVAQHHPAWRGFGLALQAYQTRALELVDHVIALARKYRLRFMCRLVKGAYWDAEIKRVQELGLPHYPVFTHKQHTDISWLACAKRMLDAPDAIYPQFATHNASSIAAVEQMAAHAGSAFELQRLHGMGEGVYREVLKDPSLACRVYAPVGQHRDLLAYLVRRLLENGANTSFVHQLADESVGLDLLLRSPLQQIKQDALPLPRALYGTARQNSIGMDLSVSGMQENLLAAYAVTTVPDVAESDSAAIVAALQCSLDAFRSWHASAVGERAATLRRAASAFEARMDVFAALLVKEAHKTWGDAVAEVRETVDFLRYYANEAECVMAPATLPGPTGERNVLRLRPRGVWLCISPWNFPLAIFTGQIAAALVTGNTVLAKPAEQTPAVAQAAVALLHDAGIPQNALQLLHGPGETIGAQLVALPQIAGVAFTGSFAVAKAIQRALAAKDGPIVPLIAETGGINAMLVDSSALPEQVADAVLQSAFRSAGQRCSALRLLCVHAEIADRVIALICGAAHELRVGEPADFATDVGPLIDDEAYANVTADIERLQRETKTLQAPTTPRVSVPNLITPHVFEIADMSELDHEIFGPVLHVLRWSGDPLAVIDRINVLGYGLTLGLQTRIDSRAEALAARAQIGNVYVNRNVIGAVVGVQPFGGEGFSGTGPKAGGPHYLPRFCSEQTVTVNTSAAGGNASLLAGEPTE